MLKIHMEHMKCENVGLKHCSDPRAFFEYLNDIVGIYKNFASNYSGDIDFKGFINFYKNCTTKPYSFLVTDTTFATDSRLLHFRRNFNKRIQKLIMKINEKIRHGS